jgi:hypothetical protein
MRGNNTVMCVLMIHLHVPVRACGAFVVSQAALELNWG